MTGYVDLQVNGYAGVDFNDDHLTADDFRRACDLLGQDGVSQFLPTVITDDLNLMNRRISKLADFVESDSTVAQRVGGVHVEGPFISAEPGYVGAHPPDQVRPANVDDMMGLVHAGRGLVRLVTLAPESGDAARLTKRLVDEGVVVAAGHSNASLLQLQRVIDQGLALFTHLGNGCPGMMQRHDNIISRVLSLSDQLCISLIADGHHIPWFAMRNYLQCIPSENLIIVSDAISAARLGPGMHRLAGQEVDVDENGAAWAIGREHFAGCATTMAEMESRLRDHVQADEKQLKQWMSSNPSRLLGI